MSLNDLQCKNAKPQSKPYKLFDVDGLYLQVMPNGSKYWRYQFRLHEKQRVHALGTYSAISLSEARERRNTAAKEVEAGQDPVLLQKERKETLQYQAAQTFGPIALEWWERNLYKWSAKHAQVVRYRFEKYLYPKLYHYPIGNITPPILLSCLEPVSATSPIVARRLLQYCSKIFQYAQITGRLTTIDFTAGLKQVLRTPKKGHFPAIELDELPQFLEYIYYGRNKYSYRTTLALKLMLLTFPRTRELLQAKKTEVNFETALWIVPGERMKMKIPHLIPLSTQAIAVLKELFALSKNSEYIFPSINNPRKTLSNTVLLAALKKMGYQGRMCGHGFRTIAMGVALERLDCKFDVIDRQLSHVPQSEIRRAYDRAKFLKERIAFMQDYADYLDNLLTTHMQRKETNGRTPFTQPRPTIDRRLQDSTNQRNVVPIQRQPLNI